MDKNIKLYLLASLIYIWLPPCLPFSHYRQLIPNGYSVPHPCPRSGRSVWRALGHFLEEGAAARNFFGMNFAQHQNKWSKEFCETDSDGDGLRNGEELGDPDCIWQPGHKPRYNATSHPGICEPITKEFCKEVNKKFNVCKDTKCSSSQDSEVKEFVLKLPTLPVPRKVTTYMCMYYNLSEYGLDMEKTYHVIGYDAVVDNVDIIHHILIHKCDGLRYHYPGVKEVLQRLMSYGSPMKCGMSPTACWTILGAWTLGLGEYCLHENVGFTIGRGGFSILALQFHWNNPQKLGNLTDGSGIKFYYVEKRRKYNAENILLGVRNFMIYPNVSVCDVSFNCHDSNNGSIYITTIFNHMHLIGKEIRIEHRRNGKLLGMLGEDKHFSYNSPKVFKTNIEIQPKDNLKIDCCYSSVSRTSLTRYGDATSDEMCFAFLLVYPYENVKYSLCVSRDYQECEVAHKIDFCNDEKSVQIQTTPSKSFKTFNLQQFYSVLLISAFYFLCNINN